MGCDRKVQGVRLRGTGARESPVVGDGSYQLVVNQSHVFQ